MTTPNQPADALREAIARALRPNLFDSDHLVRHCDARPFSVESQLEDTYELADKVATAMHAFGLVEKPITGETSDGYHTFNELYAHRCTLFLALLRAHPSLSWISTKHADDSTFGDWFIAGMNLPSGTVTYHLPARMWSLACETGAACLERAPAWDGHTSADVVKRLQAWLLAPAKVDEAREDETLGGDAKMHVEEKRPLTQPPIPSNPASVAQSSSAPPDGAKETTPETDAIETKRSTREFTHTESWVNLLFLARTLELQRNALRRENAELRQKHDAIGRDMTSEDARYKRHLDTVVTERDDLRAQLAQAQRERDEAHKDYEAALLERNKAWRQADEVTADNATRQTRDEYREREVKKLTAALTAATQELEGLRADQEQERLQDMLPSEIATRLGQIHEGYPASEQHTKCAALITQLKQELERYEESRPMSEHEQKMIDDGLVKFSAARTKETPRHE